ncbi:MAG TPA: outer membrane lipoprotein-sorting protein [Rhizomicrobium sp.]
MCNAARRAFSGVLLALLFTASAAAESAQDIVAGADRVRNPDKPWHVTVTTTAYTSGKPTDRNVFSVYAKIDPATRQFRDIVLYVDPPRDAGKMVLFRGTTLWFYDPASKDSIRIPPQEMIAGQASAGDLLVENLAVDYTATLLGDETIDDAERKTRDCWHLELKAANEAATYNRVEYWVEKTSHDPIKAKFFSDSGRQLKTLYYRKFAPSLDGIRPMQAIIIDAVDPTLVTTLDFSGGDYRDIPDFWFQRDYLPHVKAE